MDDPGLLHENPARKVIREVGVHRKMRSVRVLVGMKLQNSTSFTDSHCSFPLALDTVRSTYFGTITHPDDLQPMSFLHQCTSKSSCYS